MSYLNCENSASKAQVFEEIDQILDKDQILVLNDISQFNYDAIMALHGICDEGYKIEESVKPVILMTIKDDFVEDDKKSDFEQGGNLIKRNWEKDLGSDKIYPLISRIASVVVKVLPDNQKCL